MDTERGEDGHAERQTSRRLLRDSIKKKITYFINKTYIEDTDIYNVFKEFFSEYLEIKYEFTCLELKKELDKIYLEVPVRKRVNNFIDKLRVVEYDENALTEEEIRKLFKELDSIVDILIKGTKEKKGFVESFKKFFFKQEEKSEVKGNERQIENKKPLDEVLEQKDVKEKDTKYVKIKPKVVVDNANITGSEATKESEQHEPEDKQTNLSREEDSMKEAKPEKSKTKIYVSESDNWLASPQKDSAKEPEVVEELLSDVDKALKKNKKTKTARKRTVAKRKKVSGNKAKTKDKPSKKNKSKRTKSSTDKKAAKKTSYKNPDVLLKKTTNLRNKEKLKNLYTEILDIYNNMSPEMQTKYYHRLNKLYLRIKK